MEISGSTSSEVFPIDGICVGDWIFGVYDANGCNNPNGTINLTFEAPPEMVVEWEVQDASCYQESEGNIQDGWIQIDVTGGCGDYSFDWEGPDGFTSNQQNIQDLFAGDYYLNVNDGNQNVDCIVNEEIEVGSPFMLEVQYNIVNPTCIDANDGAIVLIVNGGNEFIEEGFEYYYSVNDSDPVWFDDEIIIDNLEIGEYTVIVSDQLGCSYEFTETLIHIQDECLDIPTLFTPNGDTYNDAWTIPGIQFYPDAEVQVFNRWGQLIFDSHNYSSCYDEDNPSDACWDGTSEGGDLPFGVYYFTIYLNDEQNKNYHGGVAIKR